MFAQLEQFKRAVPSHMGPTLNEQQTKMRSDIEQKLKRRAEIGDAVLIEREKQLGQEEEDLKNERANDGTSSKGLAVAQGASRSE